MTRGVVFGIRPRGSDSGGGGGLPAWLPAVGSFADIGTSTLNAAKPSGWPTSESSGPFLNWSGGAWAPDFGAQGGYVVHGSGHLTVGTISFTATRAITEHGIFSASSAGTMLDRSVFSAINGISGDAIQFTYELTLPSGS